VEIIKKQVIIIGGGAAGLVAAIFCAKNGADTIILEKNNRIGKKILVTGNGRCNLSNINLNINKYNKSEETGKIFNQFSVEDTLNFFKSIGLMTYADSEGRIYPSTDYANSVLDVLRIKCENLNVKVVCNYEVKNIIKIEKFIITGTGDDFIADSVIVTTGGGVFEPIKKLGHSIVKCVPSLTGFKTEKEKIAGLSGIKINAKVSLNIGNKIYTENGEVIFKDEGISGIVILNMSAHLARQKTDKAILYLDLLPEFTEQSLLEYLINRKENCAYFTIEQFFTGMLHKNIARNILKSIKEFDFSKKCSTLTDTELEQIVRALKNFELKITGFYDNAQVTSGGVNLSEVINLQSKLIKGLYFAGEVLDIDGQCGGYNLQWAWSSGAVAGKSTINNN